MSDSVSSKVREKVDRTPFLREMLRNGLLSCTTYAHSVKASIGEDVREEAIVMALRRYAEELRKEEAPEKMDVDYTLVMHTNISALDLQKNSSLVKKLGSIYEEVSQVDFLNVILGNHEVSVAVSDKDLPKVEALLKGFKVLNRENDLVAITMVFGSSFLQTPGVVYEAARRLALENINVIEIISTISELTFVIKRKDSFDAYRVLQNLKGE